VLRKERRGRCAQRYRLWRMQDAPAEEQNEVLAELLRTLPRDRSGLSGSLVRSPTAYSLLTGPRLSHLHVHTCT
jgi:hypothetical protein